MAIRGSCAGALAGLAPAALILGYYLVTGGPIQLGLLTIVATAVAAGWLVGPRVRGTVRADLAAMVAYFVVGYLLACAIDVAITVWIGPRNIGTHQIPVVESVRAQVIARLIYFPIWAVFLSPVALVWMLGVRVIRRRVQPRLGGSAALRGQTRGPDDEGQTRRLGLAAAAIIVGYGAFVVLAPMIVFDQGPTPPWWYERPVTLFGMLAVPAVVAAIAAIKCAKPLLMVAGFLCLLQAFVSFSGITLGFVVPGILLLRIADDEPWSPQEAPIGRSQLAAGIVVIGLTLVAWASLFSLTAPRCWVYTVGSDGVTTVVEVPAAGRISVSNGTFSSSGSGQGSGGIASGGEGCSSAELTGQGIGVAAALAIGATAVAARAPSRGPRLHQRPPERPAGGRG